jgi:hypothetical protein
MSDPTIGRTSQRDAGSGGQTMRDEEMLAEIEDFIQGFNQPTYRAMRINGQGGAKWSSQHGWCGDTRPMQSGSINRANSLLLTY